MKTTLPAAQTVVMVEDYDPDFECVRRGFDRLGIPVSLQRFAEIAPAANYLRRIRREMRLLPCLVILDLRLPDGDGRELLRFLRSDSLYQPISKVVWSASTDPAVIADCYRNGAQRYLPKTADPSRLRQAVEYLAHCWKSAVVRRCPIP